jgi:hypothetical protein
LVNRHARFLSTEPKQMSFHRVSQSKSKDSANKLAAGAYVGWHQCEAFMRHVRIPRQLDCVVADARAQSPAD